MITVITCSWCHAYNGATDTTCTTCGHDADKARALCRCAVCKPMARPDMHLVGSRNG